MMPRNKEAIASPFVGAASSPGPDAGYHWLMTKAWQTRAPGSGPRTRPSRFQAGMRVAVIDIGTNSTRLLAAEGEGGEVSVLERPSTITLPGPAVDTP